MNIAAFVWGVHPSSNYRAIHPLTELARRGHLIATFTEEEELTPSDEDLAVDPRGLRRRLHRPLHTAGGRRSSRGA